LLASPYWWTWLAYLLVLPLAYALMPGQLRESVKALWAPVGAFLSRLSVRWLWEGVLFAAYTCFVIVLKPITWDNWPQDGDEGYRQPRRLAYMGFDTPIKT
jgi:membrane protein implicated in regulation of membrane protease activity